jgi:hypothetical protein
MENYSIEKTTRYSGYYFHMCMSMFTTCFYVNLLHTGKQRDYKITSLCMQITSFVT